LDKPLSAPQHRRISDDLRSAIADRSLGPGARLPSESELGQKYGVSRTTVRLAIATLSNEGLVSSESGRGTFVRDRRQLVYRPQEEFRPQPASPEMDRFMAARIEEGRSPSQTIDVAILTPPEEVRSRLQLAEDETVVVRRRIRSLDGEPWNTNDSYFPRKLVEGSEIMTPVDIARGANQVLAEMGQRQVRALDEVYVRMPRPEETHRLKLGPGTPVAVHVATGYTEAGDPVRCVINVLPGDRHVIAWERLRPEDATEQSQ